MRSDPDLVAHAVSGRWRRGGLAALASVALAVTAGAQSPAPLPGTIAEHVHWSGDPRHGFAVYRPTKPLRPRAPLLIVLDPGGDAIDMLRTFAPAAEKLGWVVRIGISIGVG